MRVLNLPLYKILSWISLLQLNPSAVALTCMQVSPSPSKIAMVLPVLKEISNGKSWSLSFYSFPCYFVCTFPWMKICPGTQTRGTLLLPPRFSTVRIVSQTSFESVLSFKTLITVYCPTKHKSVLLLVETISSLPGVHDWAFLVRWNLGSASLWASGSLRQFKFISLYPSKPPQFT